MGSQQRSIKKVKKDYNSAAEVKYVETDNDEYNDEYLIIVMTSNIN